MTFSGRFVRAAISVMEIELVLLARIASVDALAMAVRRRLPAPGLVAHSDRGSQYASDHYRAALRRHGITCSMSRTAQCWDNAPGESFFASLKPELVHD